MRKVIAISVFGSIPRSYFVSNFNIGLHQASTPAIPGIQCIPLRVIEKNKNQKQKVKMSLKLIHWNCADSLYVKVSPAGLLRKTWFRPSRPVTPCLRNMVLIDLDIH